MTTFQDLLGYIQTNFVGEWIRVFAQVPNEQDAKAAMKEMMIETKSPARTIKFTASNETKNTAIASHWSELCPNTNL